MRTQFEPEDLAAIAQKILEILTPALQGAQKAQGGGDLLTVEDLAAMLKVDVSWVYKAVQHKEVPYIKVGKYTRFKKSEIMKHLEVCKVPAASPAKLPRAAY